MGPDMEPAWAREPVSDTEPDTVQERDRKEPAQAEWGRAPTAGTADMRDREDTEDMGDTGCPGIWGIRRIRRIGRVRGVRRLVWPAHHGLPLPEPFLTGYGGYGGFGGFGGTGG